MATKLSAWICGPFLLPASFAQTLTGACDKSFEADFQPGREIRMQLRSGDVEIRGGDAAKVIVTCEVKDSYRAWETKITFRADSGDLRVRGGPTNDFRVHIQIPHNSNLMVRVPAGDVSVRGVTGDKDVEVHAGDLEIEVGDARIYRHADASLLAGDLSAPAFDVDKGGLFRSFRKINPEGKYVLHAHVGAGDITLRN